MSHSGRVKGRAFLVPFLVLFLVSTLVFPQAVLATSSSTGDIQTSTTADIETLAGCRTNGASISELDKQKVETAMRFFTENKGQFGEDVRFVASTEFGKAVFYDSGIVYALERHEDGSLSVADSITLTF